MNKSTEKTSKKKNKTIKINSWSISHRLNNIDIIYTIKTVKQPRSEFDTN